MVLNNRKIMAGLEDGLLCSLYDLGDASKTNLVIPEGSTGLVSYTFVTEDIKRTAEKVDFIPYLDRINSYDTIQCVDGSVVCIDTELGVRTKYYLDDDLVIESECINKKVSEFALNFDLNFMGNKGTDYSNQLLPTSPYTSEGGKYTYFIITRPNGRFMVIMSETMADGWRLKYSPVNFCHYIDGLQFIASFDKQYNGSERKTIKLRIFFCDNIDEVYTKIGEKYNMPYCINIIGGGYGECAVKCSNDTEWIVLSSPSGRQNIVVPGLNKIAVFKPEEYGLYTVTPYVNNNAGLNTTIWNGINYNEMFKKSCDSIKPPYHVDHNLCEGGMFLWTLLIYMNKTGIRKYDSLVLKELEIIMGENGNNIIRRTILPYKTEKYDAYHISGSSRIQEQFTGVSILLEAYKLYGERKFLNHAVCALTELTNNWISDDGMIFRYNENNILEDYTTVYAPIISIVDMAVYLMNIRDKRGEEIAKIAVKVADFLVRRGTSFPTEGEVNESKDPEMEDGSISCTALSVLYVYKNIKQDARYLQFAEKILKLHDAWAIYTPDARMYQSSFRWWETIWEGDGMGPSICAGHAWTIWRAEALYLYGILACDEASLLKSWNGFVTNFAKINNNGESYSCYEADYIRGGGSESIRAELLQLRGENIQKSYTLAHKYPIHTDASLSRYVWIRYEATWSDTAAIINQDGNCIGINTEFIDGVWKISDDITKIYIGDINCEVKIRTADGRNLITDRGNRLYLLNS